MLALCSKRCHLKNKDVIHIAVIRVKGRKKIGTKYEMVKERKKGDEG
jgi:hypothetical protein